MLNIKYMLNTKYNACDVKELCYRCGKLKEVITSLRHT